jgi:hypothetical protein
VSSWVEKKNTGQVNSEVEPKYEKYEPKRQWCWLLQCIVMAALTKGLPNAYILLEKYKKKIQV